MHYIRPVSKKMLHYDLVGRECLNSNNVNRLVLYALCIALAITQQSAVWFHEDAVW